MTTNAGRWRLTDYLTVVLAVFAVAAGVTLLVDDSLRTLIQLRPADRLVPLPWWGAVMLLCGFATAMFRAQPRLSRWGVRVLTVEAVFLAICNIGEAISLTTRPGPQLGWLGALLWSFVAATGLGVVISNEQRA